MGAAMIDESRLEVCKVGTAWEDGEMLGSVISFSAVRSIDAEAPEIDSGDLEVAGEVSEGYVRVYLCRDSPSGYAREAVGTYLLESMSDAEGTAVCELWSVLHPASERRVPLGYYVPQGSVIPEVAAELLSECLEAPVTVKGDGEVLSENVVASDGDTYLALVWAILGNGWGIDIDGAGHVSVRPNPTAPELIDESELNTEVKVAWDLANVPNAVTVTDGIRSVTAINDDPASPTSTVARGRRIDSSASGSEKDDAETLEAYAYRSLAEQSKATQTAEYEREYSDSPWVGALALIPGREGEWRIFTQSLEFDCGLCISETSKREVSTYAEL